MTSTLTSELEQEAATTRRVLERLTDDRLSWAPHEKSMTLGQLALHIAVLPAAITELVGPPLAEIPEVPLPEARSTREILETLDASVSAAVERIAGFGDEGLRERWRASAGGRIVLDMTRTAVIRSILLNHWYHHRGQLTVYLRLLNVPVPSIYGPTADENPLV